MASFDIVGVTGGGNELGVENDFNPGRRTVEKFGGHRRGLGNVEDLHIIATDGDNLPKSSSNVSRHLDAVAMSQKLGPC